MKRLLIHGDAGVSQNDRIRYDGEEEVVCFQVNRNADWHGAHQVQLWCIVGDESERDRYDTQRYIPHFLDTISVDAADVIVEG